MPHIQFYLNKIIDLFIFLKKKGIPFEIRRPTDFSINFKARSIMVLPCGQFPLSSSFQPNQIHFYHPVIWQSLSSTGAASVWLLPPRHCEPAWKHSPRWAGLASSSTVRFILSPGSCPLKLTFVLEPFLPVLILCGLFSA